MMTQNQWDAAKAFLRWKFITIQSYLKKRETSKINNLTNSATKKSREKRTKKTQSQQKEKNHK